jgi:hypothetical protein
MVVVIVVVVEVAVVLVVVYDRVPLPGVAMVFVSVAGPAGRLLPTTSTVLHAATTVPHTTAPVLHAATTVPHTTATVLHAAAALYPLLPVVGSPQRMVMVRVRVVMV